MKKYTYTVLILLLSIMAIAQTSGEITPQGVIYPRYTTANRPTGAITIGTTIFNTTLNTHQYYNGSTWVSTTNASGESPWTLSGNTVHNNSGTRVGINSANPTADLEIQGLGGLLVTLPYTVTNATPSAAITMPYSGTLPTITSEAGRILDPGGTGNFLTNTNYSGYIRIVPPNTSAIRLTLESLDLGPQYGCKIIFSSSSNVNALSAYILVIENNDYPTSKPFLVRGESLFIHFIISSGTTPASGFQLLFEKVSLDNATNYLYSEPVGSGIMYSHQKNSLNVGLSRASGVFSTALGNSNALNRGATATGNSTATGEYSTAMGVGSATGDYAVAMGGGNASGYMSTAMGNSYATNNLSTALGYSSIAQNDYATAIGYRAVASANKSMTLGAYSVNNNTPSRLVAGFVSYVFWTKENFSTYVMLNEGSGSWTGVSDSTKKERFKPVNGEKILQSIAAMPLTSWNFKQSTNRHYGPMAQDFFAAFGKDELGTIGTDTTINSGDFDGINLIAIQALEKRTQILTKKNGELSEKIELLELLVNGLIKKQDELENNLNEAKALLSAKQAVLESHTKP